MPEKWPRNEYEVGWEQISVETLAVFLSGFFKGWAGERLGFYGLLLGVCVLSAHTGVGQPYSSYDHIETYAVTEGVYVARWPDVMRGSNVTLIIDKNEVFVVDGSYTARAARAVIAQIQKLTDKPVRYLINTHAHGDHYWGNQAYVRAYPGIEIVAHRSTREDIVRKAHDELQEFSSFLPRAIASYQRTAEKSTGKLADFFRMAAEDSEVLLEESSKIEITPPTMTFGRSMVFHRGEQEVQLLYFGRGNTRGDAVVYLPREKVVITGDLVVHPTPYGFGSFPTDWIRTLRHVSVLDFEHLIPGHGAVQHDKAYLELLIEILEFVVAEVDEAVSLGLSLEETQERVSLDRFEARITGGRKLEQFLFRKWFGIIGPAYEEAKNR